MTNTSLAGSILAIAQYHGYYLQGLLTSHWKHPSQVRSVDAFSGFLVGIIQATDGAQDNMIKKIFILKHSMGDRKNLCHDFP